MKSIKDERRQAELVSAVVDSLIQDPDADLGQLPPELNDAALLITARRFARLPSLLGPVEPRLEQVQARVQPVRHAPCLRLGWAIAAVAAVLLAVGLLSPMGQTAVASFMAVFNLGRTEVRITPVYTPTTLQATAIAQSTAVQRIVTLEEAGEQMSLAIPQPLYLPAGYQLQRVISHTYPDLPAWVPQPLFVELVYGDGQGHELSLRVYPIRLGDKASTAGLNLQAAPIQDVNDVDVNGQPGVLLRLGTDREGAAWQEVVWEQGDSILALSTSDLTEADLLRIARSIQ